METAVDIVPQPKAVTEIVSPMSSTSGSELDPEISPTEIAKLNETRTGFFDSPIQRLDWR